MEHNSPTSQSSQYGEGGTLQEFGQTIEAELETVRSTAKNFEEQLESFVRERPISAVFTALGAGFIVARIFSRR